MESMKEELKKWNELNQKQFNELQKKDNTIKDNQSNQFFYLLWLLMQI